MGGKDGNLLALQSFCHGCTRLGVPTEWKNGPCRAVTLPCTAGGELQVVPAAGRHLHRAMPASGRPYPVPVSAGCSMVPVHLGEPQRHSQIFFSLAV